MTDNTSLVPLTALDRLRSTTERTHDQFVAARTRRSLLLIDCSSSMHDHISTREGRGERKIDALRTVVEGLRATHPVPMAAFPPVELVESIPDPHGMTPLAKAIDFGRVQEANHLVVVTDGEPDPPQSRCYEAAAAFGGPIDVFYIGSAGGPGALFCAELARRTGGQFGVTDLAGRASQKELAGRIQLLIGDGR